MNNDNEADDAPHNGERPVVNPLETERQELERERRELEIRRLEHEIAMRRLELERQQLLIERERLRRAVDDGDAQDVLMNRWRQPFQIQAIADHVLAREQQLADSAEEDSDTVSPAMVELNPPTNDIGQQQ